MPNLNRQTKRCSDRHLCAPRLITRREKELELHQSGVKWWSMTRATKRPGSPSTPRSVRVSISIPTDDYADIKKTATRKRVSVAWVVRDALQDYLRNQAPLLRS